MASSKGVDCCVVAHPQGGEPSQVKVAWGISMRKDVGCRRLVAPKGWWWISFPFLEGFRMVRLLVLRFIRFLTFRITNLFLSRETCGLQQRAKDDGGLCLCQAEVALEHCKERWLADLVGYARHHG
ncbi:hypothetical protein L3X38_017686 [Prunus dulcis]|uniref:Uncharacterized protein n=1 Tax=Prunus dulcis TaxID=3755 RepID=A0AAD4W7L8_PRUDU|nr:hypothetical protein L3X38_017686 [Prunus dulcis]